jgi:CheY-like chemotaxis protein
VLVDFDMPKTTGAELAVHLRKTPAMKDVPVVLLVDGADEDHRAIADASGVAACIDKMGDEAALVNLILSLLDKPGPSRP